MVNKILMLLMQPTGLDDVTSRAYCLCDMVCLGAAAGGGGGGGGEGREAAVVTCQRVCDTPLPNTMSMQPTGLDGQKLASILPGCVWWRGEG
jgi:hypothetical protein